LLPESKTARFTARRFYFVNYAGQHPTIAHKADDDTEIYLCAAPHLPDIARVAFLRPSAQSPGPHQARGWRSAKSAKENKR
jgi:hypothetical protein